MTNEHLAELDDALLDDVLEAMGSSASSVPAAVDTGATASTDNEQERLMEELASGMESLLAALDGPKDVQRDPHKAKPATDIGAAPQNFGTALAATMDRLQQSDARVQQEVQESAAAASSLPAWATSLLGASGVAANPEETALLMELLQQLDSPAAAEGEAKEGSVPSGGLEAMMEEMMSQLMSKDVLYEPLRDLAQQQDPRDPDLPRYRQQYEYCQLILKRYDQQGDGPEDPEISREIADLMQNMQDCGAPPPALLQQLAPGMDWPATGSSGNPPEDPCKVQ